MPMHFSGVINSKENLISTITANLESFGFTTIGSDLHKETLAISFTNQTSYGGSTRIRIYYTDGAGDILSSSPAAVGLSNDLPYPVNYELFCYEDPLECYLIINYNSDSYLHVNFGLTTMYGGKWPWLNTPHNLGTTWSRVNFNCTLYTRSYYIVTGSTNNQLHLGMFTPVSGDYNRSGSTVYTEVSGSPEWISTFGSTSSIYGGPASGPTAVIHMLCNTPSAIDGSAILAPVYAVTNFSSNRRMIVANPKYCRFTRNDNILPGESIMYGSDVWKVFPWLRRNTSARDGGNSSSNVIDHSGTFALALKEI